MRVIDKRIKLSRRELLKTSGASAMAMTILPTGLIVGAKGAWAASAVNAAMMLTAEKPATRLIMVMSSSSAILMLRSLAVMYFGETLATAASIISSSSLELVLSSSG